MIPLNYHHLYYFWTVAKSGSITKASKKLYLAQPTLSLQIRQLEKSLGHRLFHRTREGISLTAEGRIALDYCERIFLQGDALARRLGPRAQAAPTFLRLGVSRSVTREVVLAALDAVDRSGAEVATTIYTASPAELMDRLSKYALEAAICDIDLVAGLGGSFSGRLAGSIPVHLVATPSLKKRLDHFPWRQKETPMLLRSPDNALRHTFEDYLRKRKARYCVVAESEDVELLRILALRGRGVAALSELAIAEDVARGRLETVAERPGDLKERIWIISSSQPHPDPALEKALSALAAVTLPKPRFPRS